ncbi:putative F-box protein At5g55150 [Aegilops tauschii subsp. strangulata]|uniref:F-box domain-containing protein n=1 Tax=Aegilops tauschii TaxID=37682 RepID=M8B2S8_AEGTA|nr:probable F-box protein At4g22165 [Aegilops tauschii subsp. strangulata]XP_020163677.1 probable F-box protein At4g22165 [Aegilops tauschii subsp. strangulata]XP_044327545.1 probable F-box protein At4g22165 [Triticum aestivum]
METEDGGIQTTPDLPQDILMAIFAAFQIPDLVRAGSVCSSWRSAYETLRNLGLYNQSQTPCLLYTSESDGESTARLYSLVEKKAYRLTLPDPPIRTRSLIGSSPEGLLVTADDRSEMHLLNPITGQQIALPSVITIRQVSPIYDDSGVLRMYRYSARTRHTVLALPANLALSELRHQLHHKAFVFPLSHDDASLEEAGGHVVVLIHNPSCQLSFARAGAESWTWLPPHTSYDDCMYKDGLMHAVTSWGEIHGFDLASPAPVATMKIVMEGPMTYRYLSMYIIQAPWGDLLQVWRKFGDCDLGDTPQSSVFWTTGKIRVYKVDAAANELERTSSLRGHALFLGHNQSLCLRTEEYPSLKANHAYFTDDCKYWTMGLQNNRRDMGVLNLDDNSSEELVSPRLWSNRPAPIWITPNLREINFNLDN